MRKGIMRKDLARQYGFGSRVLASGLIWAMVSVMVSGSSVPAFAHARHTSQSLTASALPPHERALQALNRLTFGPRPGDVARVEAMGVDKWIDQQLHPEKIDDTALEARLDSYPAMRLSERDLLMDFPAEPLIKAVADGKMPVPNDPVERVIYNDRIFAYQQKQADKADKAANAPAPPAGNSVQATVTGTNAPASPSTGAKSFLGNSAPAVKAQRPNAQSETMVASAAPTTGPMAGAGMSAGAMDDAAVSPSIKAREQHLYADLAATGIVNLPPAQRVAKILSMQPADLEAFTKSLTGPEKRSLVEDLTPQQRETLLALKNPGQLVGGRVDCVAAAARCVQQSPAGSGDDGLLAEPLQCVPAQGAVRAVVPGRL